jgi:glutathione peroxidase
MRSIVALVALAVPAALVLGADKDTDTKTPPALNFKMKAIDGKEVELSKYKGKVVMIVNVASQCGLTPQYRGLVQLHDKYAEKGLVVLGVPANEFGSQEPGTDEEIAKFCQDEYKVKFPMLSKVVVKGKGITPLYDYLTSKKSNPKFGGPIKWNFTKFLIGRNGEVVGRFEPGVKPDDKAVIAAVDAELKKK